MEKGFKNISVARVLILACASLFLCSYILAVEIPLGGSTGGTAIGYVDMQDLLKGYSKVAEAKEEYNKLSAEKNAGLAEMENKITGLRSAAKTSEDKLSELKQKLKALKLTSRIKVTDIVKEDASGKVYKVDEMNEVSVSTISLTPGTTERVDTLKLLGECEELIGQEEETLRKKNEEITTAQKEYSEKKAAVQKELRDFEKSRTLKAMGEIYRIIEEMAKEENLAIVVEKTNVLYGRPAVDITEKVKERLRGK